MRNILTILFLVCLTVGAVFLFKLSITQTLIDIDIEELAQHSNSKKDKKNIIVQTYPTIDTIDTKTEMKKETISQENLPTFKEDTISEIKRQIITPPPLKKDITIVNEVTLTITGIIASTNMQRMAKGLNEATLNTKLSDAASAKLQDMFSKQYFGHVSPDGKEPSYWAEYASYAYKLIGENLAMGYFSDDNDLVTAWMNSPGHRENILKPEFTEIGIAVRKGTFDGNETWIAVQIFGRPMPVCVPILESIKTQITENQNILNSMNTNILTKKEDITNAKEMSGKEYREKIDKYNELVEKYNALIENTETLVEKFNISVHTYNNCIENG